MLIPEWKSFREKLISALFVSKEGQSQKDSSKHRTNKKLLYLQCSTNWNTWPMGAHHQRASSTWPQSSTRPKLRWHCSTIQHRRKSRTSITQFLKRRSYEVIWELWFHSIHIKACLTLGRLNPQGKPCSWLIWNITLSIKSLPLLLILS